MEYIGIVTLLLLCGLLVAFIMVNHQRNNRVLECSQRISALRNLNTTASFHELADQIDIERHFDNKSHYLKISTGDLMAGYIRDNIVMFTDYLNKLRDNQAKKAQYDRQVAMLQEATFESFAAHLNMSEQEYAKREGKLFQKNILSPTVSCVVKVYMTYRSPKGKVFLSKSDLFTEKSMFATLDSVSRQHLPKKVYQKLATVERGMISDSLRYDILARDQFRCVICGASAQIGTRLHVDHIVPISKGGKSVPSNLRTLCERCNIGKGAKIEDPMQAVQPTPIVPAPESNPAYIAPSLSPDMSTAEFSSSEHKPSEQSICPSCGGNLVVRNGRHGKFYGCSRYPNCRYTRNLPK